MCYGVPVGSPEFVTHKLREKAEEIIRDANKTREVLATDPQSLWTALRLSVQQRFQYLMQLRSLEDSCGPAYLATRETAIPFMAGRGKVCPQLAGLWGGGSAGGRTPQRRPGGGRC